MKTISAFTLCILSSVVSAEDLCSDWEKKIEPDMQISEGAFTKEVAVSSHIALGKLIESGKFDWYEPLNYQKFIYGYLLKHKAEDAMQNNKGADIKSLQAVDQFCTFIVNDAFYYD